MARLNINFEPVPEVAPTGAPQNDYFHISASPEAFGVPGAKGLEALGQGIERAGVAGLDALEFHDKVATDYEINNFIDARTKIEYGDPSKTTVGPDGNPVKDTGYFGTTGRVTLDQQQGALNAINDARLRGRANLTSDRARLQYDTETRRMWADAQMRISQHADQQQKTWAQGVNATSADLNLNGYAATIVDHPEAAADYSHRYIDSEVKNAQLKYGKDRTIVQDVIANAKRNLLEAQVNAVAVRDPAGAVKILDDNKDVAGAKYDDIRNRLRQRAETQTGVSTANRYVAEATTGTLVAQHRGVIANTVTSAWRDAGASNNAIAGVMFNIGEESSFNPTLRHPDQPRYAPSDERHYAHGLYQEGAEEWSRYESWLRVNHPGSDWRDPALQSQFAAWNLKTNYPGTWARMNAAATPEDAAAIYAREYLKPAAQFLQSRLDKIYSGGVVPAPAGGTGGGSSGGPAAGGVMPAGGFAPVGAPAAPTGPGFGAPTRAEQLSAAMTAVINDPGLNDHERDIAVRSIEMQFRTLEIADGQNARAQKEASDHAAGGYITDMANGLHTQGYDFVALSGRITRDPNLTWETKAHLLDRVAKYSGEERALEQAQAFGPGYMAAREGLFSAPDAPGHISDFSQLVTRPDITLAGLQDLNTRMKLARGNVDRQSIEKRLNSLLTGAKHDLSFEEDNGFFKMRDPKGEAIYHQEFVPSVVKQASELADEAERTGDHTKIDKFLTGENFRTMANQYRPRQQMESDRRNAEPYARPDQADQPGAAFPPAPEGVGAEGWRSVMSRVPNLDNGQPMSHARWAGIVNKLIADPSPEVRTALNRHLEGTGITADDLLELLQPEARPENAEAAPATLPNLAIPHSLETAEGRRAVRRAEDAAAVEEQARWLRHGGAQQ